MNTTPPILIEGSHPNEIMEMPAGDLDDLLFVGHPIVLSVGSAKVLVEVKRRDHHLIVDLAHIDGGGEGVLPLLIGMAKRYASERGYSHVEWIVHAANCAHPNPKLKRFLELKGFTLRRIDGMPPVYGLVTPIS